MTPYTISEFNSARSHSSIVDMLDRLGHSKQRPEHGQRSRAWMGQFVSMPDTMPLLDER
jgi:hypothetical protein